MLIDGIVIYKQNYSIHINREEDPFFYYFDWDERSYTINMEFQHFHQFYEICVFLDEKAGHLINGSMHDMRCCDIVAIRPSLLHKTVYPEGSPKKRLIINFALPGLPPPMENYMKTVLSIFYKTIPIYRFEGHYKKNIMEKLNDIYYLSQTPNELTNLSIHNKFIEFLTLIYSYQSKNVYNDNMNLDSITNKIYSITAYIHKNYTEDLSLNDIANQFYISNCYLSHQFKRITGFTLTDYIQQTRIRNAQHMLLNSRQSITDISLANGFGSFSQFNRSFNKFVGMSPSKFRESNMNHKN